MTWDTYLQQTKGIEPRPLLQKALPYVSGKRALDLGAGAMNDSRFLLENGFNVLAVDANANARVDEVPFLHARFEDLQLDQKFDLVNAQFSLPFIGPADFARTMQNILSFVQIGGIFTGQFFGIHDAWAGKENMTFVTEDELRLLFNSFELIEFLEEEAERTTADGSLKHWHLFSLIARRIL